MRKKRILKLGWEFPPILTGGLGIACYGLAKALSKHADLTVVIPRGDPRFVPEGFRLVGLSNLRLQAVEEERDSHDYRKFSKVKEIDIHLSTYPVDLHIELDNRAIDAHEAQLLFNDPDIYGPNVMRKVAAYTEVVSKMARQLDFDIIHAHDWITYPAAMRVREESGKPLLLHAHSLETDRSHPEARNAVYDIEQGAMQVADRIIAVSGFTRESIINYYGIDSGKVVAVLNGIEPVKKFHTEKPGEQKWVLFLGRITRQKGPYFLFETALKLARMRKDVIFYVAGIGDLMRELQVRVAENDLSDHFVFTGFISKTQVADLLSKTDAYFMPSVSEPFGLSALEAAQFDIPCIISKQAGVAEVLNNALKADFWDTDKFADYLNAVLSYDGIRQTVIEQTQKDIQRVDWQYTAEKILEVYNELAEDEKPPVKDQRMNDHPVKSQQLKDQRIKQ